MVKKYFKFIILVFLILLGKNIDASNNELKYLKGIKEYEFKQKPYIVDAVSDDMLYMIPLRETMESLGYSVRWYRNGTIKVNKGFIRATLVVNEDNYLDRYDVKKNLYITPLYNNGVCYVPNTFFSDILNYDIFTMGDAIYLRSKIDGIVSKTSSSIINLDESKTKTSKVEIVYPTFTKKDHLFINDLIKKYIEKIKDEYRFEKINLMYDIGISNSKVVSVIFRGDLISGKSKENFFDSLNFDVKNKKQINFSDIVIDTKSSNKFIKEGLKYDGDNFSLDAVKMYLVKDAVVIYQDTNRDKTLSKYYKLYELEHLSSLEGEFLFDR